MESLSVVYDNKFECARRSPGSELAGETSPDSLVKCEWYFEGLLKEKSLQEFLEDYRRLVLRCQLHNETKDGLRTSAYLLKSFSLLLDGAIWK